MNDIELIISEGIKKGKWIDISYKNSNNEITYYWIAINDINLKSKNLNVSIFNDNKSLNVLNATIRFENILSAKILEFTTYETPKELIKKIEKNRDEAKWLKYESFNNNILRYYLKCSELDNDPYQTDSFLMAGIDKDVLLKSKKIILDDNQERVLLRYLKQKEKDKTSGQMYYFILSFLSIEDNGKKYVVLYYDVRFNPINKILSIDDNPRVNQSFIIEGKKHTLGYYIDINPIEFVKNITKDLNKNLIPYTEIIRENLKFGEIINQ